MTRPRYSSSARPFRWSALAAVLLTSVAVTSAGPTHEKSGHKKPTAKKPKQAPVRDLSKGNTLYVVPYAHLDTQWRWAYPQVIREYIANTLNDNFALIDKYPHYVFNFSGSRRYEMMKEYYPAEYERLKGYIKAGRWFPCGSSVDEGDANVPSGESLIRHILYGNRYFRHEFGVASQEFMLPDCFGFPYALPSILAHCGLDGFSTQKLTWGSAVGIPFKVGKWIGPDGRFVVAALDPGSYGGSVNEDLSQNTGWLARIQNTGRQSGAYVDYHYYGTGDRGGAPNASSVEWIEKSIAGQGPVSVVSSKADEMVKSLTPAQVAKLPQYQGELLLTEHSAGSITSQAYMKRWNRKSEQLADAAERASVAAMWLGRAPYPSDRLYWAWDLVLGSQMHDMLPGTSIPKAYEFCWNDFLLAQNAFASVTQDAVGAVTSAMDTRAKGRSVVVYNPLSIGREDVVEMTVPSAGMNRPIVYGPDGVAVPTQEMSNDGKVKHILFVAKVPATSFTTFDVRSASSAAASGLKVFDKTLENQKFRVTLNRDGDIASIYDKVNKREVLKAPARLAFQYHNPSAFPAWNMDWTDAKLPPRGYVHGPATIEIAENGPARVALRVTRETDGSRFVQTIRLAAGAAGDRVEVLNKIDWQTRESALKASFPLTTGNPKATYDLQLGAIQRGNNDPKKYEVPQHQWLDLTGTKGDYGVAILNDGKFGSDKPDDDTVRLTLLYTPGTRSGFNDQATQDFGRQETLYAIQPHVGDWRKGNVPWTAKRVNQPLRVFSVASHPGSLGKSFSLVSTNTKQVEISALKKAEDGNEVIVRLRELEGRNASGVQIYSPAGIVSARELNGQEMPIGGATVQNGALVTNVPAYSFKTFAVKLGASRMPAQTTVSNPVALNYDLDAVSTDKNRTDGKFDASGRTYAAEQFPSSLAIDGIKFRLGSTKDGAKNAVVAHGQTIKLPTGQDEVYILASSASGDVATSFAPVPATPNAQRPTPSALTIQDWSGYVGQWDNRLWADDPGPNFSYYEHMNGLVPGWVKPAEVAFYASHRHHPVDGNEYYQYSYVYKYGLKIPRGTVGLKLPNDPRVRIFAISVARNSHDVAQAAQPLYDTLADHRDDGSSRPSVSPSSGTFTDATPVTLNPPLYFRAGGLHYTLDGSTPTASSPLYKNPILLSDPTTIHVAEVDAYGHVGPVATATLDIHDTTPPAVVAASSPKALGFVRINFSERVDRQSAENVANYRFASGVKPMAAELESDGRSVELTMERPLAPGQTETVSVSGVKDLSHAGNAMAEQRVEIAERVAVLSIPAPEAKVAKTFPVRTLPTNAKAPWTINLFCRADATPEPRTMIAGFGRAIDGRTGTGRYFTVFDRGINFWSANKDVATSVRLDLGKWQMLTATYDGSTMRLYKNGQQIAAEQVDLENDQAQARVYPPDAWERKRTFQGDIRDFTIWDQDLSPAAVRRLWETLKGQ
ncbi:glycoside hydrolase family 38 C-terminal domain-containing protein [Fimbriimonas ginsengisoli]|uniref:Alpha-mannosidase n=1 Tax=Fimbriimonas ginsengisoli Gsoil 348 TaxID=661478 RepID=A0A068NRW1_FIMGI|nr:glycoside hydrolase family 38 C-terminal domain-containing protein [Fimbriimonas ginsengisoli]AIE84359.1 alpha-mannosidase [Fimbriimonas ginsengisoli Gsoil 348]